MANLQNKLREKNKKKFSHANLISQLNLFHYLCGLNVDQFNIILDCALPCIHLISYPDCVGDTGHRRSEPAAELLLVLTIVCGWVIFLATLFNEVDLKPPSGYVLKKMPKIFVENGHGLTDLVIDAIEFKFQHASNFELNSLMFSNYENTQTGKALVGISPHGRGILFSDIYPGLICDSKLTEECGAVHFVESENEITSDRGFSIQELCAVKGITLNRPKQKENDQFAGRDIATNFDIAATRIHVERFIGRVPY